MPTSYTFKEAAAPENVSYEDRTAASEQNVSLDEIIFSFEIEKVEQTVIDDNTQIITKKTLKDGEFEMVKTFYDPNAINRVLTSTDPSLHSIKLDLIALMIKLQSAQVKKPQTDEDIDRKRRYNLLLRNPGGLSSEALEAMKTITGKHSSRYMFYASFTKSVLEKPPTLESENIDQFIERFFHDWANQSPNHLENGDFGGRLKGLDL